VRFVRALSYRHPALRNILTSLGADTYYFRGFSFFTPTIVKAARSLTAVSILALTSDHDLEPESGRHHFGIGGPALFELSGRLGYEWFRRTTLSGVDCVVVQNETQLTACAKKELNCRLLPSILDDAWAECQGIPLSADVVWVGNVGDWRSRSKGIEDLTRLAERLPAVKFVVVGEISALRGTDVLQRLERAPNVKLTGALTHDETVRHIAGASVVLNTSPSEGFSNVMLEGWSLRKPAVSLWVDPDHLLTAGGLGVCAGGDEDRMASELRSLLDDPARRAAMGDSARAYVLAVHGAAGVCARLELLVRSLAVQPRPST
jgi:glycosyltransferase involved in cell wall biosynthesis